ncbi:MAG: hypothetical protein Q9207_007885, partial [Kuettlingeria erythrocarpa]
GSGGSHLIYPEDPPGFAVLVDLDPTIPILAERIYLIALTAVADWAHQGWNHIWSSRHPKFSLEKYGVVLSFRPLTMPNQQHQLKTSQMILGLLHLIDQMEKRVEGFCASTVSTVMEREPTAFIRLALPEKAAAEGGSWFGSGNTTSKVDTTTEMREAGTLANTNRIIDPEDSNFAIAYKTKGEKIPCVDLLSAALYAMATAAQGKNDEFCEDLAGFNGQSTVVYRVHGKRPTQSMHLLAYEQVRRGLVLLVPTLYGEGKCEEVQFTFEFGGDVLGGGSFELSGSVGVAAQ